MAASIRSPRRSSKPRPSASSRSHAVQDFDAPSGKGVTGIIDGRRIVIGNRLMMQAAAIDVASLEKTAEDLRGEGATAIFVAIDGKPSGVLAIADPIKATTSEAIAVSRATQEFASSC